MRRTGRRVRRERAMSLAMRVGSRRREVRDSEGKEEVGSVGVVGRRGLMRVDEDEVRGIEEGGREMRMRMEPIWEVTY